MNMLVQAQQFNVDTLHLTSADVPVNHANMSDRALRSTEPQSSVLLTLWLMFGAVLTLAWAATLVWLASYALDLL